MRFFLDHNVPASVVGVLTASKHDVIVLKDAIAPDAPDPIVALTAAENDAILLSFDKDFRTIAGRLGVSHKRLRKLSRIQMRCKGPAGARRLQDALSLIEHEWALAQSKSDKRVFIEVLDLGIKTVR
jgi:predicted nuclease of predicted toxin-antitoxin system